MPFVPVPTITHIQSVDTVNNPVTASQVTGNVAGSVGSVAGPVGSVLGSTIGQNVPYLGVDAFYWPQISGQNFAPTLGSNAVYTQAFGPTCIQIECTGVGQVTFTQVPRYAGAKKTLTYTFAVLFGAVGAVGNGTASVFFKSGNLASGNNGFVQLRSTMSSTFNDVVVDVLDAAGNVIDAGLATLTQNTWYNVAVSLNANTTATVEITDQAGHIIALFNSAAGLVPLNTFKTMATRAIFGPPDATTTNTNATYVGPLAIAYS